MGTEGWRLTVAATILAVFVPAGAAGQVGPTEGGDARSPQEELIEHGRLLSGVAGCANCHRSATKDGPPYSGGRPFETDFGVFHAPNITPDTDHGIGGWRDEDFLRALREGRAPDGSHYYPSFPYTSYTGMTDEDILAIKAYLDQVPPVAEPAPSHELNFPWNQRWGLSLWKLLRFEQGPFEPPEGASPEVARGSYLVEAIAHCGECHTPRRFDGSIDHGRRLAGTRDGPEGGMIPNITPHEGTGIGTWSDGDIRFLLEIGMTPDGDIVGSTMYEVIDDGTALLPPEDIRAIATYLRTVEPIENPEAPATQP